MLWLAEKHKSISAMNRAYIFVEEKYFNLAKYVGEPST